MIEVLSWLAWLVGLMIGAFIVLPVLAYVIMKFGAAGFFRAKEKHKQQKDEHEKQDGEAG